MNVPQTFDTDNQRPPKPNLVWRECDFCDGSGYVRPERTTWQCSMCRGAGGWWRIDTSDPNKETAGADLLAALAVVCVVVVKVVAG